MNKKKLWFIVLAGILSLSLCFGLTACGDKTVESLQNELGALLEGGNFEEGSVLNFEKVDSSSEEASSILEKLDEIGVTVTDLAKAYIYDIFVTKDGVEVQPDGTVKLTVPVQEDEGTDYQVFHVKDSGEVVKIPATYADGKISFETDGFSYYIIVVSEYVKTNDNSNNEQNENYGRYQHTLTITVDPANAGHIEIDGEEKDASGGIALNAGESYSLQAIENEGYVFVGWYDGDELLAEDDTYSHYLNSSCHLTAKFKEAPYTLDLNVSEGGSIALNGETLPSQSSEQIDRKATVTLTTTADSAYEFVGWYDKATSALLSEAATYTFTMDGDKTIEAQFKHLPAKVSVTISPEGAGYFVLADGTTCTKIDEQMEVDTLITVKAVTNFGYKFLYWENMDVKATFDEEEIVFSVSPEGLNYRAVFVEIPNQLIVSATVGGTVGVDRDEKTGATAATVDSENQYKQVFESPTNIAMIAFPDEGYRFIGWFNETYGYIDVAVAHDIYTVAVEGKVSIEARFEKIAEYTLTATAGEGGTLADSSYANGKKVEEGTSVTLTATPNIGYHFVGWFSGESKVSDNASYTFTVNENTTLVAKFEKVEPAKVSMTIFPEGAGYFVLADGTTCTTIDEQMEVGTSLTIKAVANFGYTFLYWDNLDTEMAYSKEEIQLSVPQDGLNYCAVFAEIPNQLIVTVVTADGGNGGLFTVLDSTWGAEKELVTEYKGAYEEDATAELFALENDGYRFVGWFNENNECVSSDSFGYAFNVTGKIKLEARFEKIVEYTLTATAGEGGTITDGYANGKKVAKGTYVTLTATPNTGYHFVGWFSGENKVSGNAGYAFNINKDTTLVAKFEKIAPAKVSVTTSHEGGGYFVLADGTTCTTIDEQMGIDTLLTIKVVANFGYNFLYWYDLDTEMVYADEELQLSVPQDGLNYQAVFKEIPNRITVTVVTVGEKEENGGTFTVYDDNTWGVKKESITEYKATYEDIVAVIPLVAEAAEGYRFTGWFDKQTGFLSEESTYVVTVDGAINIIATFMKDEYSFYANVHGDSAAGYITKDGETVDLSEGKMFPAGTTITLTAVAKDGYTFVGWKGYFGSTELLPISDEATCTFTLDQNQSVYAYFEKIPTTVFFAQVSHGDCGYLIENGQNVKFDTPREVRVGTKITLTAVPKDGYQFKGWSDDSVGGEVIFSTSETYEFTVTTATIVSAVFEEVPPTTYRFVCEIRGNGNIFENNVNANETYMYGTTLVEGTKITLTATPDNAYWQFKGWYTSDGDTLISSDATYTFELTDHTSVYAMFEEKILYNFLAQCDPDNGGYITENGQKVDFGNGRLVDPGTEITLSAAANADYEFKGWGIRDDNWSLTIISTDATKTFTIDESVVDEYGSYYVQAVFEKTATKSALTEDEWNSAMSSWAQQTNIKVFERTVTSQSDDHMGPQIMIYQLAGTAYSYDGYFENEASSQTYKGKMTYLVKTGDKYYRYTWNDGEWNDDLHEYVNGFWEKTDFNVKGEYESEVSSNIYACGNVDFSYENFTYDATTDSYTNSDGDITIAFTFDDDKVLTQIVVTENYADTESTFTRTTVTTITFGDAVVDVPTDAKCSFSTCIKTVDFWDGTVGQITKDGEKVEYNYDYLDDGTVLTLTAVADEGYVFKHWAKYSWIDGGYQWVIYSTDATYTITVDGEYGELYAVFEKVETDS